MRCGETSGVADGVAVGEAELAIGVGVALADGEAVALSTIVPPSGAWAQPARAVRASNAANDFMADYAWAASKAVI